MRGQYNGNVDRTYFGAHLICFSNGRYRCYVGLNRVSISNTLLQSGRSEDASCRICKHDSNLFRNFTCVRAGVEEPAGRFIDQFWHAADSARHDRHPESAQFDKNGRQPIPV